MRYQMSKVSGGNMKQLKKEARMQARMQKERDAQIMERLDAVDKSLKQMTAYLSKLTSYIDSRAQISETEILHALETLNKNQNKSELQNREVLKLLLSGAPSGRGQRASGVSVQQRK